MPENAEQTVDILLVVPLSEEFNTFHDLFDFNKPVFYTGTPRSYYINSKCSYRSTNAITPRISQLQQFALMRWGIRGQVWQWQMPFETSIPPTFLCLESQVVWLKSRIWTDVISRKPSFTTPGKENYG